MAWGAKAITRGPFEGERYNVAGALPCGGCALTPTQSGARCRFALARCGTIPLGDVATIERKPWATSIRTETAAGRPISSLT